jgi:uncharacterized membrane protein
MGVIFILILVLVLFIVWIYVLVWVVRDANKRGKNGTFWGLLTFFLGIIGLIIYLLARPGGNLVSCNYCRKEKLNKINALLEKLDERLAQGEITESRYNELCEQYRDEAERLKNQITEKELMKEVGL